MSQEKRLYYLSILVHFLHYLKSCPSFFHQAIIFKLADDSIALQPTIIAWCQITYLILLSSSRSLMYQIVFSFSVFSFYYIIISHFPFQHLKLYFILFSLYLSPFSYFLFPAMKFMHIFVSLLTCYCVFLEQVTQRASQGYCCIYGSDCSSSYPHNSHLHT